YFSEDSENNVYAVVNGPESAAVQVSGEEMRTVRASLDKTELFTVKGDYLFATGVDANGKHVFLRKSLIGDGQETDILGDEDLLVQRFDVSANGDVYFAAANLADATRFLMKFDATTGEIQALQELPSGLKQIVYVGQDKWGFPK